jgi:protein-L-isoaspartate O-methyltransferase
VYEAGRLELLAGKRKITEGLRLGFFTQDLAQELDAGKVALDIGADAHVCSRMLTYAHVRSRMLVALELDAGKVALDIGAHHGC